ncbi:MAG: HEAT repeat domain-containing protein [Pyrinomonadaceae bacterium]
MVTAVLLLLLVAVILAYRGYNNFHRRRVTRLHEKWQPILVDCLDQAPENLPAISKKDIADFLLLWNYFHETLREAGKDNLNATAIQLGLDEWSLRAVSGRNIRNRLTAIQTIGWLHDTRGWEALANIMKTADPVTALCAAKSLLRIDSEKILPSFLELVAEKSDWSYSTVGKLLKEAGADHITEPLLKEIGKRSGKELVRLLRFVDIAFADRSAPIISRLIRKEKNVEVLLSCLRAVSLPDDLKTVRKLLKHEDWRVRTQAAIALGRFGTQEDIDRLAHAAGDQSWWVRFRSAQALASLPGMTNAMLRDLAENHNNIFASEVLTKVREEMEAYG